MLYAVAEKPRSLFGATAVAKLQMQEKEASFDKITIISDEVKGDLVGAGTFGMKSVSVLSGKYKKADGINPMLRAPKHPKLVCSDMMEVGEQV